jgi:hypothetical protein
MKSFNVVEVVNIGLVMIMTLVAKNLVITKNMIVVIIGRKIIMFDNLFVPKLDDEKRKLYAEILETRKNKIREIWDKTKSPSIRTKLHMLLSAELDGGPCPECGKGWHKVEFNNPFLAGVYYRPVCECFIKCPNCQRIVYDDQLIGMLEKKIFNPDSRQMDVIMVCTNCGWTLDDGEKKRYGIEYEQKEFLHDRNKILYKYIKTKGKIK